MQQRLFFFHFQKVKQGLQKRNTKRKEGRLTIPPVLVVGGIGWEGRGVGTLYSCTVEGLYNTQSTTVSVPSSELGPIRSLVRVHFLYRKRVCVPRNQMGGGCNTRLRVKKWADPIRTTGEKTWHSVYSVGCQYNVAVFQASGPDHSEEYPRNQEPTRNTE